MDSVFAALLKEQRRAAGLTQEALAERAGLGVRSIQGLERGENRPLRDTRRRLADALALPEEARARFLTAATPAQRRSTDAGTSATPPGPAALPHTLPQPAEPPHNLPLQLSSFIGRAREIAAVTRLLAGTRLLTLVGTGGVGKTRLAVQVGAALLDRYPHGVWLVELAPLAAPALVPSTVLTVLGVPEQPWRPAVDTLLDALRTRQLLLVLDNCEHLLEGCARLAEMLLRACPRLQVLATGREPLGLAGEARWRVPSLSVPTLDQRASPALVARCEAVQLFLQRAQAVRPSFALTAANAASVAGICARLDGIPLALELAAGRLSTLGVADLAARLDQRFRLLTGGSRTALPRQRTLRATVEWSYELLTPAEQALFVRLSVFAGGWSLEAAEAVCSGGTITAEEVLDLLARLVEKSLVIAEELEEGSTWYRQLETLQQYGRERLGEADERAAVQRRHAAHYLALVERFERVIAGPEQLQWLDQLEREHDNLRTALAWCLDESEQAHGHADAPAMETGMRLAMGLHTFWRDHDHHREGLAWLDRALVCGAAAPAAMRAKALAIAGILAGMANDLTRSQVLLAASVALSREVGDPRLLSRALHDLGWATASNGQDEQAAAALDESLAVARAVGEPGRIAWALFHDLLRIVCGAAIERAEERARARAAGEECIRLSQAIGGTVQVAKVQLHLGQLALYEGDHERARSLFVASLPMIRALGWRSTVAEGLAGLADVARALGDYAEAAARYAEVLTIYRQLGDHRTPAFAAVLGRLTDVALEQRDWTAAQAHVVESLAIARDAGLEGTAQLAVALEAQAALAAAQSTPERALRLAGAAAALHARLNQRVASSGRAKPNGLVHLSLTQERLDQSLAAPDDATLERRLATARQALSAEEQATAWAEGQAMTREQIVVYALDGPPPAHSPPGGACEDEASGERALGTPRSAPSSLAGATDATRPLPERRRGATDALASPCRTRKERQAWALAYLRTAGSLTPRAYAQAMAVSADTAVIDLRELLARGLVRAEGTTRDRRYSLRGDAASRPFAESDSAGPALESQFAEFGE
jgi:non-specific serine/threonine protein kinase